MTAPWIQYTVRNGDKEVRRAIRLTDPKAHAAALACTSEDMRLDIFGDSHEFTEGSDWDRVAGWSFHLDDLYRLGLDITIEALTDAEMAGK